MGSAASPFEAMIGLALRGSDWQELQRSSSASVSTTPLQNVVDEVDAAIEESQKVEGRPVRVMTKKQMKTMRKFGKTVARDAGDVLHIIRADEIMPVTHKVIWHGDPELLCSYNWQASEDNTNAIFVPGEPTKWQEPALPITIEKDSGIQYADYNYARRPQDPYLPMFHAISVMNPEYQFKDVDVLADRNNLRVLLEFCQGKSNGPFRLNVFLVRNTLIIMRKEAKWWKICDGVSYGWNFERQFTRHAEGMEDASSHYRAIRYPLGPLSIVVRFEADAYEDGMASEVATESTTTPVRSGVTPNRQFDTKSPINVVRRGHIVPATQIVELKSQKHNPEALRKVACQDQLWFGRTSLLFTGPYEGDTGVIRKVHYEIATDRIKVWEERNQESLRKLPALLMHLRDLLKQQNTPREAIVLLREDKDGPLTVRSMKGGTYAVNSDIIRKHWRQDGNHPASQRGRHRGPANRSRGNAQAGHHRPTGPLQTNPPYSNPQPHTMVPGQNHQGYRGRGRSNTNAPRSRGRGLGQPHPLDTTTTTTCR